MENKKNLDSFCKYKCIVFDFDGTIATININWDILKNKLQNHIFKKFGENILFTPLDDKIAYCRNQYGENTYKELLELIGKIEQNAGLVNINNDLINEIINYGGIKVLYTMNTEIAINKYIHLLFTYNPFDLIITKNSCIEPKPTDKDLNYITNFFSLNKEDILYIGNSDADKISGKKANIKTFII